MSSIDWNTIAKSCVVPIFRAPHESMFAGTAFLIDGYLVTAGHVIGSSRDHYARIGNRFVPLHCDQWHPQWLLTDDHQGIDVTFYPMPGIESPLTIADRDAQPRDSLDVICWQPNPGATVQVHTTCLVTAEPDDEGYVKVSTVDRISHGASGCPVLDGTEVVGMLTMGRDFYDGSDGARFSDPSHRRIVDAMGRNTCWIFTSSHIRRFLPREQ